MITAIVLIDCASDSIPEVAEALAALPDPPVVLLVSVRDRPSYRRRVASSGARGFIAKDRLTRAALAEALTA